MLECHIHEFDNYIETLDHLFIVSLNMVTIVFDEIFQLYFTSSDKPHTLMSTALILQPFDLIVLLVANLIFVAGISRKGYSGLDSYTFTIDRRI